MSHLLPLSALHAAAPGVLDVVFGSDGDFEGAPRFTGPVAYDVRSGTYPDLRLYRYLHLGFGLGPDVRLVGDDDNVPRSRCALDCRVPSVAARLLRLCATAMGYTMPAGWTVVQTSGAWSLVGIVHRPNVSMESIVSLTWYLDGRPSSHGGGWTGIVPPALPPISASTGAEFVAFLTLSLAPRIASLR